MVPVQQFGEAARAAQTGDARVLRGMFAPIRDRAQLYIDAMREPGRLTGRNGDTRWQIDVGPVGGDWIADKDDVDWIPELVKLRVRGPTGATLDLETVRLMRRPKQQ